MIKKFESFNCIKDGYEEIENNTYKEMVSIHVSRNTAEASSPNKFILLSNSELNKIKEVISYSENKFTIGIDIDNSILIFEKYMSGRLRVVIEKLIDDWFIVKFNNSWPGRLYNTKFKCDQIDGVIKCLEIAYENKTV